MKICLTVTTNCSVEISQADLDELARVHQLPARKDGQETSEWLFDTLTGAALAELVQKSEIDDEDTEVDEVIDEDEDEDEDD